MCLVVRIHNNCANNRTIRKFMFWDFAAMFLFVVTWPAGFSITVTLSSYIHGAVWKYKHSSHLLVITTGTHECVAQLNPGIVSLLEGLGRRGQGPFTKLLTNAVYTLLFSSGFYFQSQARFRWCFHSAQRHFVHVRLPKTEENVMLLLLLRLQNVLRQLWPLCQTCDILHKHNTGSN